MKVVLVECGKTHGEVLIPQIQVLKRTGHTVRGVFSPEHSSSLVSSGSALEDEQSSLGRSDLIATADPMASGLTRWTAARALSKKIAEAKPDWVVLNTLEDHWVQPLSFWLRRKVRQAALLHRTEKLQTSARVRANARRMQKIFVLNEHLLHSLPAEVRSRAGAFYPINAAEQSRRVICPPTPEHGSVSVCIPGQLEFKRRDYRLLCEQEPAEADSGNRFIRIEWNCLGPSAHSHGDGDAFKSSVDACATSDTFLTYPGFLDEATYWKELHRCSFVLPLITPRTPKFDDYLRGQITGAYNLAFTLGRPLLMHEAFRSFADFRETAFFYSMEPGHLRAVVHDACTNQGAWLEKAQAISQNPKWTPDGVAEQFVGQLKG